MKQTIAMKQAAFEELMREHGFQYLGAVSYTHLTAAFAEKSAEAFFLPGRRRQPVCPTNPSAPVPIPAARA